MEKVFECTRCGYCCKGETTVSLDKDDQRNMLEVLKITREEAFAKYWRQSGKEVQMKVRNGHCIFYDKGCKVHMGRPWRCRQWPLVPGILSDKANLDIIMSSCPGISKEASYSEICEAVRKNPDTKI